MCYYNGQKVAKDERIRLKHLEKLVSHYDFLDRDLEVAFEHGPAAVIKPSAAGDDFNLVKMEWGFIPHYIKTRWELEHFRKGGVNSKTGKYDPPIMTMNAVGEELFQKITFKKAAAERRCLVLSTGFYEWRHIYPISRKTGKPLKTAVKYPYFVTLRGKPYFFMAGLWSPWTDQETGEYVESFAIVTTRANALMEQVHNSKKRMPVILDEDRAWEWLFGRLDQERILELATYQCPSDEMEAWPLAKDFLSSPHPQKRQEYEELPAL